MASVRSVPAAHAVADQALMVQTALVAVENSSIQECQQVAAAFSVLKQGQVAFLKAISIDGQISNPVTNLAWPRRDPTSLQRGEEIHCRLLYAIWLTVRYLFPGQSGSRRGV